MTRVDLDAIQKILNEPLFMDGAPVVALDVDAARFLVAELRAAREVVEATRHHRCSSPAYQQTVWPKIAAYYRAVGS